MSAVIHDFSNPPVTEVVCGVTFRALDRFLVPHLGLLWNEFKSDYPICEEQPPLAPIIEEKGNRPSEEFLHISAHPPMPRVWFVSDDKTRLFQVQRDRFLYNWRKMQSSDDYPRFPHVIRNFGEGLERLSRFVEKNDIGEMEPLQYELTYVNLMTKGDGWDGLADIGRLLPDFSWRAEESRFLQSAESIHWQTTFAMPDDKGRLRVTIQDGVRKSDGMSIVSMNLTARGMPCDPSLEAMYSWFETAREWIVSGFVDLTGEKIQRENWGRTT